jgi:hypothetical protein
LERENLRASYGREVEEAKDGFEGLLLILPSNYKLIPTTLKLYNLD